MRRRAFTYEPPMDLPVSRRHQARSLNFDDSSIYSYSSPGSHWWGYA